MFSPVSVSSCTEGEGSTGAGETVTVTETSGLAVTVVETVPSGDGTDGGRVPVVGAVNIIEILSMFVNAIITIMMNGRSNSNSS